MYLLAILLPPVSVLMAKKPLQAIINLVLCLFMWVPAVVHALFVVNAYKNDKRFKEQCEVLKSAIDRKTS